MSKSRFLRRWFVLLVVVSLTSAPYLANASSGRSSTRTVPTGETGACLVFQAQSLFECFGSEKKLDQRVAALWREDPRGRSILARCPTGLRPYDLSGYSGTVLVILDRSLWTNLSSYGFDNRTSSYKVGACSSYFAEKSSGGGGWYPTSATQAWNPASSMQSGWNNRVSSVYQT